MNRDRWYHGRLWHGMTFSAWMRLLYAGRFGVSPERLPMTLSITLASLVNSALRAWQNLRWDAAARQIVMPPDPVFIIGHWRTGTTLLHTLLAADPSHRCPSTYESLSPNHFLVSEGFARRFLPFVFPRLRPMDRMPLGFDTPQEDEIALCLRGVPSPFAALAFPDSAPLYSRYCDLESLTPAELERWEEGLCGFLRLLLLRRPGRLILKSPQHTFRLKTLSRLFPRACFVHLVRNPFEIFPSTIHLWTEMHRRYGLRKPDPQRMREQVFETLIVMYRRLENDRVQIDASRFCELRFEDLTRDPVAAVESIYRGFGWSGFPEVRGALTHHAAEAAAFQRNRYQLSPDLRREIAQRWAAYIDRYGYGDS